LRISGLDVTSKLSFDAGLKRLTIVAPRYIREKFEAQMRKEPLQDYWSSLVGQIRGVLQLNQDELAEKLGTTQASVSRWEKGERIPTLIYQRMLEQLALEIRVESINGLLNIVNASPFPMIITDEQANVLAASESSGFSAGSSILEQTPEEERKNFENFSTALRMSGFWDAEGQRFDYEFQLGNERRRAVVQSIMVRGVVYAVVQRLDE
jgi:transcriptional regulator with XRE-family HTH domain